MLQQSNQLQKGGLPLNLISSRVLLTSRWTGARWSRTAAPSDCS